MLEKVIATLNAIEVHGKDNIDMLLGCILTLEQLDRELNKQPKNPNTEEDNTNG